MNRILYLLFILIIPLCFIGCWGKKKSPNPDEIPTDVITTVSTDSSSTTPAEKFYELGESVEDILKQIAQLKARVSEYENRLPIINYTEKLKELIDDESPSSHKIALKNKSVIEGTIEKDMGESYMVMTKVGKLTINKKEIESIQNMSHPEPDIIFIGHGQEEVFDGYYLFTGKVLNQGSKRGDFVRVIYQLWGEDTQMINSDSTFIVADQVKFKSGVVTDTSLEPNKSARFSIQVATGDTIPVSYITREVHWLSYD